MREAFISDLRFTFRLWRRAPGFYTLLALTLALGLGAATAVYSIAVALVLRPLPFPQPRRIVEIQQYSRTSPDTFDFLAGADYLTYRRENTVFSSAALYRARYFNLTGQGEPIRILAGVLQPGFFHVLRISLREGRGFTVAEAAAGAPVAIVSYRLWRTRYAGDPNLVGRTIQLDGESYRVVGITPRNLRFTEWAQLYVPLNLDSPAVHRGGNHSFLAIARLRPGVTLAAARGQIQEIARRREKRYPINDRDIAVRLVRLPNAIYGQEKPVIALLLAAAGLLLLLACANTAGLLLARSRSRRHEIALRASLGATRGRLLVQLMLESLLLALLAGLIGLLWAPLALKLVSASGWLPAAAISHLRLNFSVLAFALLITAGCGILFGLAPALENFRGDLRSLLQTGGGRTLAAGNWRAHRILIGAELAMLLVLLGQAGLLARSLLQLNLVPLGLNPAGVMKMSISFPDVSASDQSALRRQAALLVQSLAHLPGARAAAGVMELPPRGYFTATVALRGVPADKYSAGPFVHEGLITPGYFRTLGIPLLAGRKLAWSDTQGSLPVAVVNRALVRFFWPHANPLGLQIEFDEFPHVWWTVVGEVGDTVNAGLRHPPQPQIYFSLQQAKLGYSKLYLLVRGTGRAAALIPSARRLVYRLAPGLPVMHPQPLREYIGASLSRAQFRAALLLVFAFLAVLLAALGIYGLVAHAAGERRRELAIRSALGASPNSILRLFLGEVLRLSVWGVLAGLLLELWLARLSRSLLFHLSSLDPVSLGAGVVVLSLTVLLAAWWPARRAAFRPAAETLREE